MIVDVLFTKDPEGAYIYYPQTADAARIFRNYSIGPNGGYRFGTFGPSWWPRLTFAEIVQVGTDHRPRKAFSYEVDPEVFNLGRYVYEEAEWTGWTQAMHPEQDHYSI